jgi:hypothetical protein
MRVSIVLGAVSVFCLSCAIGTGSARAQGQAAPERRAGAAENPRLQINREVIGHALSMAIESSGMMMIAQTGAYGRAYGPATGSSMRGPAGAGGSSAAGGPSTTGGATAAGTQTRAAGSSAAGGGSTTGGADSRGVRRAGAAWVARAQTQAPAPETRPAAGGRPAWQAERRTSPEIAPRFRHRVGTPSPTLRRGRKITRSWRRLDLPG